MEQKIVTIVGGTGFLGRYVVRRLARAGYRLRVVSRRPEDGAYLRTAGTVGQIALMGGDLTKPESLLPAIDGAYAVVNLVGIMFESGSQNFTALHAHGAEKLAQMAASAHIPRFIHVSALGVDKFGNSRYARSKALGEKGVRAAFPHAVILRPSVVFGPEDNFINLFASMAALLPALPLIGGGKSRFQPVYVDDVAKAVEICLEHADVEEHTYELGGPRIYTFKEILQYILHVTGKRRALVTVPFGVASLIGALNEVLPRPLLTRDQVTLLKQDNIVSPNARTLSTLGIAPVAMEIVVPEYLARFCKSAAAA